ncbi:hypothetical protein QWZ06_26125 [Chryseobacterium tructae]|uniref:hypothetical protein n=1 Tax=Chryseobacterium tructae TaxID=1037380 RepID=UPI0025B46446|nr:hypothetical protein [Chryseobacterium tructae]MDN3695455.1 hypothetical protein [Chryseobacterium tructae]
MPITINTPQSYFFTDSAFTQLTNPTTPIPGLKSFGPIDPERFQITTTFKGNLNAYAVTAGILLIGKQAGSTDKINIILKPTGTIGVGVKIKYFIYRGINASDFLKNLAGTEFINENSYLDLIKKVWKAYTEFNATTDNLKGTDIGLIDATAGITKDILKKYFDKNNYNLLKVNEGTLLGKFFQDSGGFEIVLDDGDYSQEKSDTGLNFDLSFITATSTILTTKDSTTANLTTEFGAQSNTQLSGKIFKENIHKFLDPAAFYGSHVTDNTSDIANTGIIYGGGTSTPYCSMSSIYNNIVKKFKNKYITYFYVKGNKNRSLNFYNNTNELKINGTVQNYSSGWPIIITSQSQCSIDFTNIKFDDSFHSSTFLTATSALSSPSNGYLFSRLMGAFKCNLPFTNDSGTRVFSSFTYLYFNDSSTNQYDYLFGPANLASIFDREDYTSKLGAAVNNLKKVLIRQSDNVCNYSLKLILDGYLADSHPTTIPTDPAVLASTLRTYILFPQETEDIQNVNATYYSSGANNSHEYCSKIYGSGEIWKGKIYDAENISALLYRRKDNDESKFPIHQLGISQADYIKLTNSVYAADEHATNLLFYFDNEYLAPNGAFFKYDLKIEYDKRDGTREKSIVYISIYTIDTFLFFSKEYANNFPTQYCETFADIAVDFLPHNLASHNTGYKECGFDYIGFDGREKYRDIMGNILTLVENHKI